MANSQASSFSNSQLSTLNFLISGWGGIRTPGAVSHTPVFKTGALNHSATQPDGDCNEYCIFLEFGWSTSGDGLFSGVLEGTYQLRKTLPPVFCAGGPSLCN